MNSEPGAFWSVIDEGIAHSKLLQKLRRCDADRVRGDWRVRVSRTIALRWAAGPAPPNRAWRKLLAVRSEARYPWSGVKTG